ncbi:Peptidase S8/S53 domain [Dillenia turbinata]|uniref:Peptidase S8/S53 domain n=1 Tax=Dillenia turbinata TaxID=194707 RepID=A0AAN8UQA6_9MAGN
MNETTEYRSPRDSDGHGTHTASIAAGRYVFPASTLGYARGVAAGMAPKARLAAYKVCWNAGCYDSDILAAFDAAVSDGVDVISLSVGGVVVPYYLDAIAIGAFGASDAGIFVSASAGNGGPGGLTVTNVAPWVTTVGAGSIDRDFPAEVKLGNGKIIAGESVYSGPGLDPSRLYTLTYAGSEGGDGYSSSLCLEGSLDPNFVKGKIVVCDRGINSRAAKGEVVRKAGGIGMILANGVFDGEGLVADCHVLPAAAVGATSGDLIRRYVSTSSKSKNPATATIVFRGTRLGLKPAPVVASFSARGPNPESPEILKPDAIDPGLIYDLTSYDYIDFLCNSNYTVQNIKAITRKKADCSRARRAGHVGNLNYPSMSVVFQQYGKQKMSTHFIRTVTNVGDAKSVYVAKVIPPEGATVTVQPEKLVFRRVGQKLNFLLRVQKRAVKLAPGSTSMTSGSLIWEDGKHIVTSPIVVTMQQPL